ncbi:MAG: DUF3142 domain-containing protein [Fimbriimonas sp.]
MKNHRERSRLCLARTLALAGILLSACQPARLPEPEIGMWYWHTPFRITAPEAKLLDKIGVSTLYVRAGTFATDGSNVRLILPQTWQRSEGPQSIVLVTNFDAGLVRHLETFNIESASSQIAKELKNAKSEATKAGLRVTGFQIDVDCPTRLLPKYAEWLHAIRRELNQLKDETFSITALPTWLTSGNIQLLAKEVDFLVPQFYEGRTGKTAETVYPVSDPEGLKRGLDRLGRLGIPAQVGLATYGHALMFDETGALVGMYRGLSAEDALRHPTFAFESSTSIDSSGQPATDETAVGEDRLVVRATRPDRAGQGRGFRIAYTLPTPEMVVRQINVFRQTRPANVRGYILYRFPESGESMTLPLASVAAALRGEKPTLDFVASARAEAIPWDLIDRPKSTRPPMALRFTVRSTGTNPTMAGPDALILRAELNHPGIEGIAAGDFDEITIGTRGTKGQIVPSPRFLADTIELRRFHTLPGEVLRSGAIQIPSDGATKVVYSWKALGPGGRTSKTGEPATVSLLELK